MDEKNKYDNDYAGAYLQKLTRTNSFIVPNDFFEDQKEKIKTQIQLEKHDISSDSLDGSVPEGYFNSLENNIHTRIAEEKLKEQVSVDGFTIPETYFSSLNTSINDSVFVEKLKSTISDTGFQVPDNYFLSLENAIHSNIVLEELTGENNTNRFDIPAGYFESLENNILLRVKDDVIVTTQDTPIRSLSRLKTNIWSKYAAAAVILLVGIGTYFTLNSDDPSTPIENVSVSSAVNLHAISDDEIVSYLAQVSDDDDELMDLAQIIEHRIGEPLHIESDLKNEDIEEYLNYML